MSVKKRLIEFIKHTGKSQRAFEIECGLSNGLVNNIKGSISPATSDKISARYPELSMAWIITEEGQMLKKSEIDHEDNEPDNNILTMDEKKTFKHFRGVVVDYENTTCR